VKQLSVIVPCRNESEHIDRFLDALAAQELPEGWNVEWLIADGASDDGTRERLLARARADARVVVVDNPRRIVSTGLNACLAVAHGGVIARLDVHTEYASDYLAQCLAALERTGADNVGGPWVARGITPMQRAIAAAFQCAWVVGGARSRDIRYEGATESVYLGCWPRATFRRFGQFDESLVRNQDDEHNLRIVRGGGSVWQSAAIHSVYRPRAGLAQLFAQQRQYGYWRVFVLRKHGMPASWRQLVPAAFLAACTVALLSAPWAGLRLPGLLAAAYCAYLAFASMQSARLAGQGICWRLPGVIVAFHAGYGAGMWQGVAAMLLRRAPSTAQTELTR
jgi:glycosyltransferase involved in cell wall biosynthesis